MPKQTISNVNIKKLYDWTDHDLNLIYKNCFLPRKGKELDYGPTNSFFIVLMALVDIWGSIMRNKFDYDKEKEHNKKNVIEILTKLSQRNPTLYEFSEHDDEMPKILRHNIIHTYGKKKDFDLNISTTDKYGKRIRLETSNNRWQIDCKGMKDDFLNLLKEELPNILN